MYQIAPCPMVSQLTGGLGPRWVSTVAWEPLIAQFLGSGWKLVEIFEDHSSAMNFSGQMLATNVSQQKNCLWIFEKPASRIDDPTPHYEATMVEHWFTQRTQMHGMGFGGVSVHVETNWEPVIDHYGRAGWQVVRIMETPDTRLEGAFNPTVHQRQLIFFQRLREGFTETGTSAPNIGFPSVPPPAYPEKE